MPSGEQRVTKSTHIHHETQRYRVAHPKQLQTAMTIIKIWKSTKTGPQQVGGAFSLKKALEKGREAGGSAHFKRVVSGTPTDDVKIGYKGHYFVYLNEAEAKKIDTINAMDSRYSHVGGSMTNHPQDPVEVRVAEELAEEDPS